MRTLFILTTILLLGLSVQGQNYASSVGLSGGYVEDGFGGNATFNFHMNRYSYIQIGIFASFSNEEYAGSEIPYNVFAFQPGYYRRIAVLNTRNPISFYIGGGAIGGYEIINNGKSELPSGALITARSQFIYGGFAGGEIEFQLKENLSLAIKGQQHYHVNSDIGKMYPFIGGSIRYYLY